MPGMFVAVDSSEFRWNQVAGTMVHQEFGFHRQNIEYWMPLAESKRIPWVQSEIARLDYFFKPQFEQALSYNQNEIPDMIDTPVKKDFLHPSNTYEGLDDTDIQLKMSTTRKPYIPVIKWFKEQFEYKYKFMYDLREQLTNEIRDIQLHNSLIPRCFSEIEQAFSEPLKHPNLTYSLNFRIDDPRSTPMVLTNSVVSAPGGSDLVVPQGPIIPAPPIAPGGGGPGGGGVPPGSGGTGGVPGGGTGTGGGIGAGGTLKIGVTVEPVFVSSAGGTITGGSTASNDPRFQVFTFENGTATGTYQIQKLLNAGQSTTINFQIVPAASDLTVDLKKLLAAVSSPIKNPLAQPDGIKSITFNLTPKIKINFSVNPSSFAGDGVAHSATITFKVVP